MPSRHCPPAGPRDGRAVWTVALDRLADDDPVASALLTLAAWLGTAPVPLTLLTGNPQVLPEPLRAAAGTPGLADHAAVLDRRGLARFATAHSSCTRCLPGC